MLSMYPAIFFHEKDGGYSVVFPDLNHLSTCGDTFQEAMEMAVDCLAGYLYTMEMDGEPFPAPTPIEQVNPHAEEDPDDPYADADILVNMVSVDVPEYAKQHFTKSVKKTLSIPQWMNDLAISKKINFSKVLQQALLKELNIKST